MTIILYSFEQGSRAAAAISCLCRLLSCSLNGKNYDYWCQFSTITWTIFIYFSVFMYGFRMDENRNRLDVEIHLRFFFFSHIFIYIYLAGCRLWIKFNYYSLGFHVFGRQTKLELNVECSNLLMLFNLRAREWISIAPMARESQRANTFNGLATSKWVTRYARQTIARQNLSNEIVQIFCSWIFCIRKRKQTDRLNSRHFSSLMKYINWMWIAVKKKKSSTSILISLTPAIAKKKE